MVFWRYASFTNCKRVMEFICLILQFCLVAERIYRVDFTHHQHFDWWTNISELCSMVRSTSHEAFVASSKRGISVTAVLMDFSASSSSLSQATKSLKPSRKWKYFLKGMCGSDFSNRFSYQLSDSDKVCFGFYLSLARPLGFLENFRQKPRSWLLRLLFFNLFLLVMLQLLLT